LQVRRAEALKVGLVRVEHRGLVRFERRTSLAEALNSRDLAESVREGGKQRVRERVCEASERVCEASKREASRERE
jgi:hypothetical protein